MLEDQNTGKNKSLVSNNSMIKENDLSKSLINNN